MCGELEINSRGGRTKADIRDRLEIVCLLKPEPEQGRGTPARGEEAKGEKVDWKRYITDRDYRREIQAQQEKERPEPERQRGRGGLER
jgi:hypothetical protein